MEIVRAGEETRVSGVVARRNGETAEASAGERYDVDAIAVVVERDFIHEVRADRIRGVYDRAIRRVAERVANSRNVRAAPLANREALRNLLGDKVTEDRELAGEVVIDANDFFAEVCRGGRGTGELVVAGGWRRKDAGIEQRRCVRADHARRDDVTWERIALDDAGWKNAARAILCEDSRRNFARGRNYDRCANGAEIPAIGVGIRNSLAVGGTTLNQAAPFHVVEEEGALAISVVELTQRDRTADVETEDVETKFSNGLRSRVEESARVKRIVAVEFPGRSMQRAGAGLEKHRHRTA